MTNILKGSLFAALLVTGLQTASAAHADDKCIGSTAAGAIFGTIAGCENVQLNVNDGRGHGDNHGDWNDDDDNWRRPRFSKSEAIAWAKKEAYETDEVSTVRARDDYRITVIPGRWVDRKCRKYKMTIKHDDFRLRKSSGVMCQNRRGQMYDGQDWN